MILGKDVWDGSSQNLSLSYRINTSINQLKFGVPGVTVICVHTQTTISFIRFEAIMDIFWQIICLKQVGAQEHILV
jgi:hypothetical protein